MCLRAAARERHTLAMPMHARHDDGAMVGRRPGDRPSATELTTIGADHYAAATLALAGATSQTSGDRDQPGATPLVRKGVIISDDMWCATSHINSASYGWGQAPAIERLRAALGTTTSVWADDTSLACGRWQWPRACERRRHGCLDTNRGIPDTCFALTHATPADITPLGKASVCPQGNVRCPKP